ncbi:MAG: ribokinase [Pseudomonadota bacterium]
MITVFGSVNCDLVVSVDALPVPGETVKGPDYQIFPGGKGGNQALAARCAGADVQLVAAVGRDDFAGAALAGLDAHGVDLTGVHELPGPTGVALIAVDRRGENLIVVASGANDRADAGWLDAVLSADDVLVMQLEVPVSQTENAIGLAAERGATSILNAAPAAKVSPATLEALSILVVNAQEAASLAGDIGLSGDPEPFARALWTRFRTAAVITRGAAGAVGYDGADFHAVAAPRITAIDTTGAGDAFTGAFAAAIDGKRPFDRALVEGVAAGALACKQTGAQSSLPHAGPICTLADEITTGNA